MAIPTEVDIDADRGLTLRWDDGQVSRFGLVELRLSCPCAQCRELRQAGQDAWPEPGAPAELRVETAELVGNWGLNIAWNDGHATGIYTWETLRSWMEA